MLDLRKQNSRWPLVQFARAAAGFAFVVVAALVSAAAASVFTATDDVSVASAEVAFDVNSEGRVASATETFVASGWPADLRVTATSAGSAPTVTTGAASGILATGATLNGTVSSNGASTTVTFQYGLTTSYGSTATAAQSPLAAGAANAAVSAAITGLDCNRLYHFRVVGVNLAGPTNGADATLTTAACGTDDGFPAGGQIPVGWTVTPGANAGWLVASDSTDRGPYSLKSATIGNGQTAAIQVSGTYLAGDVSFAARVSSELNFDTFSFLVDGILMFDASGEKFWQSVTVPVAAGPHTFKWTYMKDDSTSEGADAAWIDSVVLPPTQTNNPILTVTKGGSGNGLVSSNPPGISCGLDCTEPYASMTIVTLTATPAAGSVFMGWLGACTGAGACNVNVSAATSVSATFAPDTVLPRIDIDGNNGYDALTDGLLMFRYLSGMTGTALTNGDIGAGPARSAPAEILQQLDNIRPLLDVDGNGLVDPLTDGLMLMRYLFRLRGDALIAGAIGTGATRTNAMQIEGYIQSLMQ